MSTGSTGTAGGRVAVVTLAYERQDDHLLAQQRSLIRQTVRPDHHVVVAVDDPALADRVPQRRRPPRQVVHVGRRPEGLPLAAARNAGVAAALAEGAECVVLLDAACLAGPGLVAAFCEAVRARPDTAWAGTVAYLPPPPPGGHDVRRLRDLDDPGPGPSGPEEAQEVEVEDLEPDQFWGVCFAVHRTVWAATGGFCEEYVGFGGEDTDFARLVLRSGAGLARADRARAFHQDRALEDPPVAHLDDLLRNGRLYRDRWGSWPTTGWLEAFEARGLVRRVGDDWVRTRVS